MSANVGSVGVEVYPDAKGWSKKLQAQIAGDSERIGKDIGARIGTAAADQIGPRLKLGIERGAASANPKAQGAKGGQEYASAFDKSLKAKLEAAFRSLPDLKIDADTKAADRKLAELRTELLGLQHLDKLDLKIDNKTILANIAKIEAELKALEKGDHEISVKVNARAAASELSALRKEIEGTVQAASPGAGAGTGALIGGVGLGALALGGPLVGAAVAGLGAVAGGAGVAALAVVGFNQEIKSGSTLGHNLQDELSGVKSELLDLAKTSAKSAGPGVISGLDKIRAYLPSVNGPVAILAEHLGKAFNTGSDALVHGLQAASPLLNDAGRYAEQFATWLDKSAQSEEFKHFISYARDELPLVGHALGSVATGLINVGVALHPIGDDLIRIVDLTGKAASGLALLTKVGNIDTGNAGTGGSYNSQKDKTKERSGFRLFNDNFVGTLTGQGTTTRTQEKARVAALKSASQSPALTAPSLGTKFDAAALVDGIAKTDGAAAAALRLSQADFQASTGAQALQAAQAAAGDSLAQTTLNMQAQNDVSGLLKAQLDGLAGKNLSAAQTQNQFEQGLVTLAKGVQNAGSALDGTSEAAINNRANLLSLIPQAIGAAGAFGDVTEKGSDAEKKLGQLKDQIIQNADKLHLNKDAVKALLDQMLPLQGLHVRSEVDLFVENAKTHLKEINTLLDTKLKDRTVNVFLNVGSNFDQALNQATGAAKRNAADPNRKAGGGWIFGPGTGTSDSIPIMASNREFMSTAASAARNGAALEAGNRGAHLIALQGYADGGIVTLNPKKPKAGPRGPSASTVAKTASNLAQTQDNIRFNTGLDLLRFLASSVGTVASVRSSMLKLITDVHNAAEKGVGSGKILSLLGVENTQLQALANQRASIGAKLKAANTNVLALRTQFKDEAVKVAGATSSSFDITNLDTGSTAGAIRILEQRVALAGQFTSDLAALRVKGLNKTLIQQLGEAGVGQAGNAAHLLAGGTKADDAKVNALFAQINKAASGAGVQVAGSMYQAGIDSAVGYANGLKSKLAQVNKAAASLAAEVVKQIKKDLGIHSPSRVGHELGEYFGSGYANGIASQQSNVAKSAASLAYVTAGSVSGSGGGMKVDQHFYQQPGQDSASLAEDSSRRIAQRMR